MSRDTHFDFQKYTRSDIEFLKKYCQQHYLSGGEQKSKNITYVPSLDHSIYQKELVFKENLDQFPAFSNLDRKFTREERIWTIHGVQKEDKFTIKPIENFEELDSFNIPNSPFCFFNKNIAQLYLYAAHQFTRLLGVWSNRNGTKKPEGVLPFLMLRDEKRHPWLYLEAIMLEKNILDTKVKTNSTKETEGITLSEALLDVIAVYTAIQKDNVFPAICTTQKKYLILESKLPDSKSKLTALRSSLEISLTDVIKQFSSLFYTNLLESITSPEEEGDQLTTAKYKGKVWLELPEDKKLTAFLKKNGHYVNYMFSNIFLQDTSRKIYYNDLGPTGWGEMRGNAEFVPLMSYIPIFQEKLKQMRKR